MGRTPIALRYHALLIHKSRNAITFVSTLHPTSRLFQALEGPSHCFSGLHKLPPLSTRFLHTGFPSFNITDSQTNFPLPPKPQKPLLPPRPGARPISATGGISPASTQSRILNPFASLFGHRPSMPTPPITSQPVPVTFLHQLLLYKVLNFLQHSPTPLHQQEIHIR